MRALFRSAIAIACLAFTSVSFAANGPRVEVMTNVGNFVIELDPLRAPLTVENFLHYVKEGFYTGTVFHRVVPGFVAQGGGYTQDLKEKKADQKPVPNESGNGLSNLRGSVGMARTNDPHSATTQFYVNLADNAELDPRPTRWGYAVFGKVVSGMDVVDKIGTRATHAAGPFNSSVPVDMVTINKIEVLSNNK
jgi:cyclophilin family peptidyl-prolyl cis-trans isomerase